MSETSRKDKFLNFIDAWLQQLDERLHPIMDGWKKWTTLSPFWRYMIADLGYRWGWKNLIDRDPRWIDVLEKPQGVFGASQKGKPQVSILSQQYDAAVAKTRKETQQIDMISIELKRALASATPEKRQKILDIQQRTLAMLLLRLHGGDGHHHHHAHDHAAKPAAQTPQYLAAAGAAHSHSADAGDDHSKLKIAVGALMKAFPEYNITRTDLKKASFSFKPGMCAEEQQAFLIVERYIANAANPEHPDNFLDKAGWRSRQQALNSACLVMPEHEAPSYDLKQYLQKHAFNLALTAGCLVMPVYDSVIWNFRPRQPQAQTAQPEVIIGASENYHNPLAALGRIAGLYGGTNTLATATVLAQIAKERGKLSIWQKVFKIFGTGGHLATEVTHAGGVGWGFVSNVYTAVQKGKTLWERVTQSAQAFFFGAGEFITENFSDYGVVGKAATVGTKLAEDLPLTQNQKDQLRLAYTNVIAPAGTYTADRLLEVVAPYIAMAAVGALGAYGIVRGSHDAAQAIGRSMDAAERSGDGRWSPVRKWCATALARTASAAAIVSTLTVTTSLQRVQAPVAPAPQLPSPVAVQQAASAAPTPPSAKNTPSVRLRTLSIQRGSWLIATLEKHGLSSAAATRIAETFRRTGMNTDLVYRGETIRVLEWNNLKVVAFRDAMKMFDPQGKEIPNATEVVMAQMLAPAQQAFATGR